MSADAIGNPLQILAVRFCSIQIAEVRCSHLAATPDPEHDGQTVRSPCRLIEGGHITRYYQRHRQVSGHSTCRVHDVELGLFVGDAIAEQDLGTVRRELGVSVDAQFRRDDPLPAAAAVYHDDVRRLRTGHRV